MVFRVLIRLRAVCVSEVSHQGTSCFWAVMCISEIFADYSFPSAQRLVASVNNVSSFVLVRTAEMGQGS